MFLLFSWLSSCDRYIISGTSQLHFNSGGVSIEFWAPYDFSLGVWEHAHAAVLLVELLPSSLHTH